MNKFFKKLWNFEFHQLKPIWFKIVFFSIFGIGFLYVLGEVIFGMNAGEYQYTIQNFISSLGSPNNSVTLYEKFQYFFPYAWLLFAAISIIIRTTIIISSYYLSKKKLGESDFTEYLMTYLLSFVIAIVSAFLLLYILAGVAYLFGYSISSDSNVFGNALQYIKTTVNNNVPSLLQVNNYWLALILTIFLSALPGYFIHWLSHKLRFFWLVTHRAHHAPQFLHPLGAPPAFVFNFFLTIPGGLITIITSKLIYTEPLVMEIVLWSTFAYCFEIFNHSIVHYNFAYNNFLVRNFTRFFGGHGVYHLVHHSAFEQDQNVNLGGSPFMFWDRIFGTYRKPYKEAPPIGLTNQPKMHMNPFRIIFSGIAQMFYELKMNRGFIVKMKIIFGGVYYVPPVSKDFLVIDYSK